jgi:hypothetical protein
MPLLLTQVNSLFLLDLLDARTPLIAVRIYRHYTYQLQPASIMVLRTAVMIVS